MELEIIKPGRSGDNKTIKVGNLNDQVTIGQIKKLMCKQPPLENFSASRIALRTEPKGKFLADSVKIFKHEGFKEGSVLYFKDLGPQIGWSTVFLCEYAGPLLCYMITYLRPALFYGSNAAMKPYHPVVNYAAACWSFHYAKRILETLFVHRFSHQTMPMMNLFKNCTYYWGFALYVGYYINHPLYTPPLFGDLQIYAGLLGFLFSELGNFSIHIALRNLRPPGTTERKIPMPTSNPLTLLFNLVSCPNYTYEISAWVAFSLMTQALPALLFTLAGGGQMVIWALGKHRNYRKEFSNYPRGRKSIIPFLI